MATNVDLIKEIYGVNTYTKVVNTQFTELVSPEVDIPDTEITVDQFFQFYEDLFFQIPVSGSVNSHTYLVEKSQEYIGGSIIDAEKQALIEEINSLRQQLLNVNQSFTNLDNII